MNTVTPATVLRLEGEVDIYRATEIKAQILEALAGASPVEVNLSGVTELDAAGLQLLILAKREALLLDKTVRFTAHSPAVLEVLDLGNLSGLFGDPVVLPSMH